MTFAADKRYGRRGGRWADSHVGRLLTDLAALREREQERGTWPNLIDHNPFHPDAIATTRAHHRNECTPHDRTEPCDATPDPTDLDAIWAGRARMAAARVATRVQLDTLDREALAR